MQRTRYAMVLVLAALLLAHPCTATADEDRPNFLFIAVDDLNTMLGCFSERPANFLQAVYPDPAVRAEVVKRLSPNIDRLAAQGRPFAYAYCDSPLCGPSRTALMTGRPTHATGYYMHRANFRTQDNLRDVVTLPQYLRQQGYYTAGTGKIFHTGRPKGKPLNDQTDWPDIRYSWDQWVTLGGGCGLGGAPAHRLSPTDGLMRYGTSRLTTEEASDFIKARFIGEVLRNGSAAIRDQYRGAPATIALPADRPFFLACGIFRPHLPFFAPAEHFEKFSTHEMALDTALLETMLADVDDLPPAGQRWSQVNSGKMHEVLTRAEQVGGPEARMEAWLAMVQSYLACVSFADQCVGELLDALEAGPYADNTVVVLWSDHGYHLGEKHRVAKQALWEQATHCVLIVSDPSADHPGAFCERPVSLMDLYPTIVARAGLERPAHIAGDDIGPLVRDPAASWDRPGITGVYMGENHTLRTDTHRYIRYSNGDTELYHVAEDPGERDNLAGDPVHADILRAMDKLLRERMGED